MEMHLRAATEEDLPQIAALEGLCFSLPRSEGEIARALGRFTVAEEGGVFLGYADVQTVLDEGYVGNLAVLPAYRGRGVGGALLAALLRQGREAGLRFLTLEVRQQNLPARALYASRGFVEAGLRKNCYEKPADNAVLMTYYFKEG